MRNQLTYRMLEKLVYGLVVGSGGFKTVLLTMDKRHLLPTADKTGTVEVAGETAQSSVHKLTPEEGMRLAKEYSRHLMKEARLHAAAENVRLQLKKEAIAALPPHLREAALVPDLTPFPPTRIPAALSPPIPGYVEEMTKAAEQASKIQKLR